MAKGQGVELEQRLKVSGISLLGGVVSIAIMSHDFRASRFCEQVLSC